LRRLIAIGAVEAESRFSYTDTEGERREDFWLFRGDYFAALPRTPIRKDEPIDLGWRRARLRMLGKSWKSLLVAAERANDKAKVAQAGEYVLGRIMESEKELGYCQMIPAPERFPSRPKHPDMGSASYSVDRAAHSDLGGSPKYSRDECDAARRGVLKRAGKDAPRIIGESTSLLQIWPTILAASKCADPVLVLGETGTGKELVAGTIHCASRHKGKMVTKNCGALASGEMGLSELFGHVKGALTGATEARKGAFREANGGTLFLDEVGELTPEAQARLLRAVEAGEIEPLGDTGVTRVDVRLICATNRDIDQAVEDGEFRRDLLMRIDRIRVEVPPLRDHNEDIPLLVRHFALQKNPSAVPRDGWIEQLQRRRWEGNVRELRTAVVRAIALRNASVFEWADPKEREKRLIEESLRKTDGNQTQAAEMLNIARSTLRDRMKEYGLLD